jgi:hypothetical protein
MPGNYEPLKEEDATGCHSGELIEMQRSCRYFQKIRWRVIRTKMGRSGSYADPPKHSWAASEDFVGFWGIEVTSDTGLASVLCT